MWGGVECSRTGIFTPVWMEVGLCYKFNGKTTEQLMSTETGSTQIYIFSVKEMG